MSGSEPRIPPGAPKEGGNNHSIQLRPRATSLEVKQKIEEALRRNAEMDAGKMGVEAYGGEVIPHGSIHFRPERRKARRTAWAASGVLKVDNRFTVGACCGAGWCCRLPETAPDSIEQGTLLNLNN
jgi:hypothetical protein